MVAHSLYASADSVARAAEDLAADSARAALMLIDTYERGGKLLVCGNGGSAADAQHIAAEMVGRFRSERRALPAVALTTDSSILTALANDYDITHMFARQVRAVGRDGDLLLAISTSGASANVLAAVHEARDMGISTVGLTGATGTELQAACDFAVMAPATETARIQEIHIVVSHAICGAVEAAFADA